MERWMMLYLLLSSALLSITSCGSTKPMVSKDVQLTCLPAIAQRINTSTYNTQVDLFGKHFSGLLVFKATSDTSKRAIFITETGFKFFDFEFTPQTFSVKYCLKGLDKKIVIKTLRRDFGYLLNVRFDKAVSAFKTDNLLTYKFRNGKRKSDYYSVDWDCKQLKRIEHGTDKHKKLEIAFEGVRNNNFDTVKIADHAAHLSIFMKQIDK